MKSDSRSRAGEGTAAEPASSTAPIVPALSVIVTIVTGGDTLRRFLQVMTRQEQAPTLEILVPYDASIPETAAIGREFPECILLDIGSPVTERPIGTAAGQHELYDRRRAAGLARARGTLISILEDRAPPRADWARQVVQLHDRLPWGVIGGAIECAPGDLLNWAIYTCDFSRYGLPFESGPRRWVSDVNVSYKRGMIDETREIWQNRYVETLVHWALLERGETLYLSSEMVVEYRGTHPSLPGALRQRFHWGRLFGHVRAMRLSPVRRVVYALLGPVIAPMLLLRHGRTQARLGNFPRFLRAAPTIALLLAAWMSGEVWGYVTNRP
ncbi:MAG: hypothetical protein SGJ01_01775 [Gemmatimonadota bacterium]|nr:hypothetical protein [Gemmatimonadota bacterium]